MRNRRAVSLVEVLVAAVLLAIGISGTLQALLASARLRMDADKREALVGLLLDRLAWFESRACSVADTSGVVTLPDGPAAVWRVQSVGMRRVLELEGSRRPGLASARTTITTSLQCS